jgi:hypothetical protein
MIGLRRRRAGLPVMTVEITVVSQCRAGLAAAMGLTRLSSGGQGCGWLPEAVSGRDWIPGVTGGDHGVQVPEDRSRDDGLAGLARACRRGMVAGKGGSREAVRVRCIRSTSLAAGAWDGVYQWLKRLSYGLVGTFGLESGVCAGRAVCESAGAGS